MVEFHPLTAERWDDLEQLFGPQGAYSGCWCMWWRVTSSEFQAESGDGLETRFRSIVADNRRPGLVGYVDGVPAGWVAVGDRSEFGRLNRSPKLRPIDDDPVASVVCFFVSRPHRRAGLQRALLDAAVDHARSEGYETLEGYPIDTSQVDRTAAELLQGVSISSSRQGSPRWRGEAGGPLSD